MFNATYFTYDGVFSGIYGLMMADFDDNSVVETAAFSPILNTIKPVATNRFFHNGIVYDTAPQHTFSIISEDIIPDIIRRKIIAWLTGKDSFRELHIHQPDLEQYYYRCVFTDIQIIYVNGNCHGFRITANFDSPYQYGRPSIVTVSGVGSEQTVYITNNSDIDSYVYPIVKFKTTSPTTVDGETFDIKIINATDGTNRVFMFNDLLPNETIEVDNELRIISSDIGGEKLSNFQSKKWLRLRPGRNELKVTITGEVTITCPTYIMIGF